MKKNTEITLGVIAGVVYGLTYHDEAKKLYKTIMSGLKRPASNMSKFISEQAKACKNVININDLDKEDPKDPIDPIVIYVYD